MSVVVVDVVDDEQFESLQVPDDGSVEQLAANDTCVAPVKTIPEVVQDEHFRARGLFTNATHDEHGTFEQMTPVLAGGNRNQPQHHVRPPEHTDTDAVLAWAGFAADEIAKLRAEGAVE